MKKIIFTFCITALATLTNAQDKKENIKVIYNTDFIIDYEKIKNEIPAAYQASFKSEIERGISVKFELVSNGKMSSFKPEIKVNNNQSNDNSIAQMIIAAEANPQFKDYEKNEFYNQKDFGAKSFLIKDKIYDYKWKITKEKADIAGYKATKAIGTDEQGNEFSAWYSTDIKYKDGPHNFANLPGLILQTEVITPYFKTIFTINHLEILKENLNISLPTKGKIVTFQEMRKELNEANKPINEGVEK